MIPPARLRAILDRHDALAARLGSGTLDGAAYVSAARELAELEPVATAAQGLARIDAEAAEAAVLAGDADPELAQLGREEAERLSGARAEAEAALARAMLPRDAADDRPAIVEVRAGTGGDEAALFAGELLAMYRRYAEERGWRCELLSQGASDVGGVREAVMAVRGQGVFARLKYESGVHRVQRVPVTESGGRIHTSAATVAILPEAEEVDVAIGDADLRIDIYRASGAGGQHVNTTDSAVRITHLPTGLVVTQQDERSQHKNKARAMQVLRARLFDLQRSQQHAQEASARRAMVGSGDRSERIRTYNFPQGRVTDHRIGLTLHRLPEILGGALDELIDALARADEAERLAGLAEA